MIKQLKPSKELLKSIHDNDILDTMYDDMLTTEIYKKYPVAKQLAVLNRDKIDPKRIAYDKYVAECRIRVIELFTHEEIN